MMDLVCGIPREVLISRGLSDGDVINAREGYNIYQQLLTAKNLHNKVICECGRERSYIDRYRCRKTKKHKLLISINQSMQNPRDV